MTASFYFLLSATIKFLNSYSVITYIQLSSTNVFSKLCSHTNKRIRDGCKNNQQWQEMDDTVVKDSPR